jgi:uncharacterized protein (TIGR00299 family) protein
MKSIYLDLIGGISGDMFISAMIDLGVDFESLKQELNKLHLHGYYLQTGRQKQGAIEGQKFNVVVTTDHQPHHNHSHDHKHNTFAEIKHLIQQSDLSSWVKQKSIAIFERIAKAESKIHGVPIENVHFHETGAIDSIVDIVGACICLQMLEIQYVVASPVTDGTGFIECAHGKLPVPTPATFEILAQRQIPISQCEEQTEMITPTGASILAEFARAFTSLNNIKPQKIGYGVGSRTLKNRPNVLRVILFEQNEPLTEKDTAILEADIVNIIESNIDDSTPEILGNLLNLAMEAGALDAFFTPIFMKKNRPAFKLTILCNNSELQKLTELIFTETSSFGVRIYQAARKKLHREFQTVETSYGKVRIKLGFLNNKLVQYSPEFESCKDLAQKTGLPIKTIFEAAIAESKNYYSMQK